MQRTAMPSRVSGRLRKRDPSKPREPPIRADPDRAGAVLRDGIHAERVGESFVAAVTLQSAVREAFDNSARAGDPQITSLVGLNMRGKIRRQNGRSDDIHETSINERDNRAIPADVQAMIRALGNCPDGSQWEFSFAREVGEMITVESAQVAARDDPENPRVVHEQVRNQVVNQTILPGIGSKLSVFVARQPTSRANPERTISCQRPMRKWSWKQGPRAPD